MRSGRPAAVDPGPARIRASGRSAQPFDHVQNAEDLGAVANHVPVTGLAPPEEALLVHHESGAVGHVAGLIVHAVRADGLAVDVAQEREREPTRLGEGVMGERAVRADRQEDRVAFLQFAGDLSQAGQLRRSDAAPVVTVESEDDVRVPLVFLERDRLTESRGKRKSRRGLTPSEDVHSGSLSRPPGQGNCSLLESSPRSRISPARMCRR